MEFNEYQKNARTTAIYKHPIMYPALGLAGETGEVCEKVKKAYRDMDSFEPFEPTYYTIDRINGARDIEHEKVRENIKKEAGDILWYLANLAADFDLTLDEIAKTNIEKLFSRKERGVLKGSGDNR